MSPSAHTALVVSIVASSVGALVMCLLVARYGLTSASEQDGGRAALVTRFGHALAGVCFAATGILAVVALIAPTRVPRPAPTAIVKVEPDRAAEARLQALATDVKALAARVDQAEARMTMMDTAARRLGDEVGSMDARARQLERTVAGLPRRAIVSEPAPKETKAAAPPPASNETKVAPSSPAPRETKVVAPPPAAPAAVDAAAATPQPSPAPPLTPEPVVAPRPRAPEPVVHRAPPPPARVAEPAASPRPSSGRATLEAQAHGGAAAAKADDPNLTDKIRDDWKTIRGGFATAGDDLKAAVRDLGKKLWR
jgi:hypothetical protein